MNRYSFLLFFTYLLSSCAISYYYKGKDIVKSHEKGQKQVNKGISQFDKVAEYKNILQQLKGSQASEKAIQEIEASLANCMKNRKDLVRARDEREKEFNKLNIKKKKKYTEKNKKEYSKVKSFVDGFKSYEKKLKGIMNKTRQDCEKPNQLVEKYDIKVLDSDSLYNQFSNHKEELQNTVVKVKKSNSKFENDVKRSKIRNKKKVLAKLNELKIILGQIESEVLIVDKEFKDLKAQYGKSKRIAVVRGTPAHDATVKLEKKIKIYNQLLTRYENKQNEIRKLVN